MKSHYFTLFGVSFSLFAFITAKVILWKSAHVLVIVDLQRCPEEKVFLEISQNSHRARITLAWNLTKKETLAQVFSCEFCDISKNFFFTEHLRRLLLRSPALWFLLVPYNNYKWRSYFHIFMTKVQPFF